MKLAAIACRNAKPKDKPYKLADGSGIFLLIQPNGARYWRLKYRYAGKENAGVGRVPGNVAGRRPAQVRCRTKITGCEAGSEQYQTGAKAAAH
jgi:hypothetical protein